MTSPSPFHEVESYEGLWDDPFEDDFPSEQHTQSQEVEKLAFCQLRDWDEGRTYNELPAKYIRYSIHWSFKIHNRVQSTNTETDLVLELASYWRLFLKPKLDQVCLSKMRTKKRTIEPEGTKIVLKVAQRSVDNFSRSCDKTDVDWPVIEKQLTLWADKYPEKKLTVEISFNYEYAETDQPSTLSRRIDKRGRFSTTQQQLHQRDIQLDAEEEATGQPSITRTVYKVMRCPGPPCNLGPHCWVDPLTKKHYKLKWHHFKDILKLVEEGHQLETQNDMPEKVRLDLYAEEQQFLEGRQKNKAPPSNMPPINIVLPESFYPRPSSVRTSALDTSSTFTQSKHLDISGPRDKVTDEYCAWQESQVEESDQKAAYQEACKIMKDNCIDLGLIYRDPNPKDLIELGVKIGVAQHIVFDIDEWKQRRKRPRTVETLE